MEPAHREIVRGRQQYFNLPLQARQFILNSFPNDIPVQIEILMNHLALHAAHRGPRCFGMTRYKFVACDLNPIRRLADNLDVPNDGILHLLFAVQFLGIIQRLAITNRAIYGFPNMVQVFANPLGVCHSGSACRSTWSRNLNGRKRGVNIETRTPSNSPA